MTSEMPASGSSAESELNPQPVVLDQTAAEAERSFQRVPSSGERWTRWYDIPSMALEWIVSSRMARRMLPGPIRSGALNALNYLNTFNQLERMKADHRAGEAPRLVVPEDERVVVPAIWVAEFYPPSMSALLHRQLRKAGWERRDPVRASADPSIADQVRGARQGRPYWSVLARLEQRSGDLPREFSSAEVSLVQIGTTLTVLVARVHLSNMGANAVNSTWHAPAGPRLAPRGWMRRPGLLDPLRAAQAATQQERQRLHDLARRWLNGRCAGFFSRNGGQNPVVDVCVFDKFDPVDGPAFGKDAGEPDVSLGLEPAWHYQFVTPAMPGVVLAKNWAITSSSSILRHAWTMCGRFRTLAGLNSLENAYGEASMDEFPVSWMNESAKEFVINFGLSEYSQALTEILVKSRDQARESHRKFRARGLVRLRDEVLPFGLDLSPVARDVADFAAPWGTRTVLGVPTKEARNRLDQYDLVSEMAKATTRQLGVLTADHEDYRSVLATAASLGQSAASTRLAISALIVSGASLVVAAVTLLATSEPALWEDVIGRMFGH